MVKFDEGLRAPDWLKALDMANAAPRCGARTRTGAPCQGPGMANGRCRMHGGKSTGPRTAEGLERCRRANWKHGRRAADAVSERKAVAAIRRELSRLITKANIQQTG